MNTQTTFYRWKFIFRCPYKAFVSRISLWNTLYVVPVKSKVKILQNFVAFSEYINFICRDYPSFSGLAENSKLWGLWFSKWKLRSIVLQRVDSFFIVHSPRSMDIDKLSLWTLSLSNVIYITDVKTLASEGS